MGSFFVGPRLPVFFFVRKTWCALLEKGQGQCVVVVRRDLLAVLVLHWTSRREEWNEVVFRGSIVPHESKSVKQ